LKDEIKGWTRDAKEVMRQRNEVMHGIWGIDGATGEAGYLTKRKPHTSKSMSVDNLNALGDRIDALSERCRYLIEDITDAVLHRTRQVLSVIGQSAESAAHEM
jgi:hypothetical protein